MSTQTASTPAAGDYPAARTLEAREANQASTILLRFGRILFALSIIGLGVEHFVFGQFVTGRAPAWPQTLPGQQIWAYLTGLIIVLAGAAMVIGKKGRLAAFGFALLLFLWALLRHIPVIATTEVLSPDYTKAVKALALVGGGLIAAATLGKSESARFPKVAALANRDGTLLSIGTVCLVVFMVNNGLQHFIYTEFVASLIPAWFPGDAVFWTYASAFMLFAGAIGMLYRRTAYLAALLTAMMIFAWVWIVHVPRFFVGISDQIAVFEAPAMAGIAFMIAALRRKERVRS
ncbi:MAG TPA: hypothetical protein VF193_16445 [Steroidobacter sp.]